MAAANAGESSIPGTSSTVSDLESESEEFVLAGVTDSGPLQYLVDLVKAWSKNGVPPLSRHGSTGSTSSYKISTEGTGLTTSGTEANRHVHFSFVAILAVVLLKFLVAVAKPVQIFGNILEYILNVFYLNGGFFRTVLKVFDIGSLKTPRVGESNYFSTIMLLDTTTDLDIPNLETILSDPASLYDDVGLKTMATVCAMAAKFAYENENVIRKTVEESWKMNFVQFYDCWNDHLQDNATQAFIFTDKKQDANIVVVAFRGTEPFCTYDWATDFDFSYFLMPGVGRIHVGFLEALGLGSRSDKDTLSQAKKNAVLKSKKLLSHTNPTTGLSTGRVLAYDAICAKARTLLQQNPRAKFFVTGHSLGAALAAVYTGWMLIENNDIVSRLGFTFTFGQPRVGDLRFSKYLQQKLCESSPRKYFRVVFRTDVVPRVPLDDLLFQFKHTTPVQYYRTLSQSTTLQVEPYSNIYVLILQPMPHVTAIQELFTSLFLKLVGRSTETEMSLLARFPAVLMPGLCSHNPAFYVDAVRRAPSSFLKNPVESEKVSGLEYLITSFFRLITFQWPIFV